jgi:tRNA(His) 5'-end guanylyltransferase
LLFHHSETTFSRKLRKYNSILAGEASAKFSLLLGDVACFDCRISELPSPQDVRDYFRWRNEDAARNALSAYCYWTLRKTGCSVSEATGTTTKMSTPEKHALLSKFDIDFDTVPQWQKRGTGLVWKSVPVAGRNPITSEDVQTERRRLMRELDLPVGDDYGDFVMQILNQNNDIQKSL